MTKALLLEFRPAETRVAHPAQKGVAAAARNKVFGL
jgi:hypothetical protein